MKRAFFLLLITLLGIAAMPISGIAGAYDGSPFTVEIILPDNNIGSVGYYHIPGEPGEKITLKAKLTNLTGKPLEVKAVPLNSYSGTKGIFYQSPDEADTNKYSFVDEKYSMAQYISAAGLITLQPKQSEETEIYVTVPDIDKGTLLGSIRFVVFAGTQAVQIKDQNSSSILIDKYKAVDTAIQIDFPGKAQTSITIGEPDFVENSSDLSVTVSNEAAVIEENVSGTYQIKDKQNNVMYEGSINAFKMAPMTRFKYLIPWGDMPFIQDTYTLYFQANANGQVMNFEIPLATEHKPIPSSERETGGNAANFQTGENKPAPQNSVRTFFLIGLVGILIVFALLIYYSYKKPRRAKH